VYATLPPSPAAPTSAPASGSPSTALGSPAGSEAAWSARFSYTSAEGAGVSACEEAGYVFGSHEHGVRGKAGTPGFWAPEMLHYEKDGKGRRYGPAADWWSFGCLVYALLSARLVQEPEGGGG
jgi:serine/threonine protein kinase